MSSVRVFVFIIVGMIGMAAVAYWIQGSQQSAEPLEPLVPGLEIFYGKGRCGLCHTIGIEHGGKCPNLDGAGDRLTREFIYEALTEPEAYVRLDFDLPQPKRYPAHMPSVSKPPIGLTKEEMDQVVTFVQSQSANGHSGATAPVGRRNNADAGMPTGGDGQ